MQHLEQIKAFTAKKMGITVILEPTKILGTKEIRIAANSLRLTPAEKLNENQTYLIDIPLIFSLRVAGGNESGAFTRECLALAVKFSLFWEKNAQTVFTLPQDEQIAGMTVSKESVLHNPQKEKGEFYRLDDDQRDGKLFLYREDWTATLTVQVVAEGV